MNWGGCQGNNLFMSANIFEFFWSKMSDSEGESCEKQVKIVLVGDGSAGKVNSFI